MTKNLAAGVRRWIVACAGGWLVLAGTASAQVAPLAPRWLAGTPPPPVETFAAGLERHHIPATEAALVAALRDPDGETRSLAAAQLAAMDDHPALTQIVLVMEDERDPQVQVNLAGAATWLGSRRALELLQTMCQDVNLPSTARLDAARYVSNKEQGTCFSAVELIERMDADPNVRVLAVVAAANYRGATDKAATLAIAALGDLDPQVRIAAADALRGLGAKGSVGDLNGRLEVEGDDTVREHLREAVRVLKLLPDPAKPAPA